MSHSARACASSRSRRRTYSSSGFIRPLPGKACSPSAACSLFHRYSNSGRMPRSFAISLIFRLLSSTNRRASCLNCASNHRRLFSDIGTPPDRIYCLFLVSEIWGKDQSCAFFQNLNRKQPFDLPPLVVPMIS